MIPGSVCRIRWVDDAMNARDDLLVIQGLGEDFIDVAWVDGFGSTRIPERMVFDVVERVEVSV